MKSFRECIFSYTILTQTDYNSQMVQYEQPKDRGISFLQRAPTLRRIAPLAPLAIPVIAGIIGEGVIFFIKNNAPKTDISYTMLNTIAWAWGVIATCLIAFVTKTTWREFYKNDIANRKTQPLISNRTVPSPHRRPPNSDWLN